MKVGKAVDLVIWVMGRWGEASDFEVEYSRDSKAPNRSKDRGFGGCGRKRYGGSGGFGEYNLDIDPLAVFGGSLLGTFLSTKVIIELLTFHSLAYTHPL